MSREDEQARAGTGESHDFQRSCCCFKGSSQMGIDGAGIHISLGSAVNLTVAMEEALQAWKQPQLECTGAHVPVAMVRRTLLGAETPWGKHLFHLGVR